MLMLYQLIGMKATCTLTACAQTGFLSGAGQSQDAQKLLAAWTQAWSQLQGLPELFDMAAKERHPLQKVHA